MHVHSQVVQKGRGPMRVAPALHFSSIVDPEHPAASLRHPDAVAPEAPGPALDAGGLGALALEIGVHDTSAGAAETLLIVAAFARDAIGGRRPGWRSWRRPTAALDREDTAASLAHPDAVALPAPGATLDARRTGALLRDLGAGDSHGTRAESPPVVPAFARNHVAGQGRDGPRRTRHAVLEDASASVDHPDAASVIAPGAALNARRARGLRKDLRADDARPDRAVLPAVVATFAGDLLCLRQRRQESGHDQRKNGEQLFHRFFGSDLLGDGGTGYVGA